MSKAADKVRARAGIEADKIRRGDQRKKLTLMSKSDGRRNPSPPTTRKAPAGSSWMLDQCIGAYLSDDDAVESFIIAKAVIDKAKKGDIYAAQFLAERTQGKPVQKVNLGVQGQLTVQLLDSLLPDGGGTINV